MNSLTDINLAIIRLKKLKLEYARDKAALDLVGEDIDAVKQAILDTLKEAKALSYKTETGTVSINRRQTVSITNEQSVKAWLVANKYNLDEYVKLDATRTKPVLANAWYEQGEVIEGVSPETTEYISLREPTVKK